MIDHTYRGTPVSQMPEAALRDCLAHGFSVNEATLDGNSIQDAEYWIRLRLEIEVLRRALGIAIR